MTRKEICDLLNKEIKAIQFSKVVDLYEKVESIVSNFSDPVYSLVSDWTMGTYEDQLKLDESDINVLDTMCGPYTLEPSDYPSDSSVYFKLSPQSPNSKLIKGDGEIEIHIWINK